MPFNLETATVDWLNRDPSLTGYPASLSVPDKSRFITVERTGGTLRQVSQEAVIAVQVWAGTRAEASKAANDLVAPRLLDMWQLDKVAAVSIEGLYDFPDPGPPMRARYQITATITAAR